MTVFRLIVFLVSLLLLPSLVACEESIELDPAVGDADLSESDGDSDGELEAVCDFDQPECNGDDILSCVDGLEVVTPCEPGAYCNYGECQETTVHFPEDAGFHSERSEWWYYTGHLVGDGHHYGFEVTIFQYDMEVALGFPQNGFMCHVAVTDSDAGEHYHVDSLATESITWTNDPIVLELNNCRFELGGDGRDHVVGMIPEGKEKDGKASPWRLDLNFDPEKRVALHGGDGIIPMSDSGGTSWYYSYTRLAADGLLLTPDGEVAVSGQGWMDHQWGQFDIIDFKGWDWWSMQFDDSYEIMLFQFTDWDGNLAEQAGTIIDPNGNQLELAGFDDFTIDSKRTWESPHTDGVYPLDWHISIPGANWELDVVTHIDDQEMYNPAQNYWEGETTITGTRDGMNISGVGYTELTGYATDPLDPK